VNMSQNHTVSWNRIAKCLWLSILLNPLPIAVTGLTMHDELLFLGNACLECDHHAHLQWNVPHCHHISHYLTAHRLGQIRNVSGYQIGPPLDPGVGLPNTCESSHCTGSSNLMSLVNLFLQSTSGGTATHFTSLCAPLILCCSPTPTKPSLIWRFLPSPDCNLGFAHCGHGIT